jgi:hypothetical protein
MEQVGCLLLLTSSTRQDKLYMNDVIRHSCSVQLTRLVRSPLTVPLKNIVLSHRKPASTVTSHDSCCIQERNRTPCTTPSQISQI